VHSSMGRAIQPFATRADGDVLYAVSTAELTRSRHASASEPVRRVYSRPASCTDRDREAPMKFRRVAGSLFRSAGVAALSIRLAAAQQPVERHWDEDELSQPTYRVRMRHNVLVPMRDGVKLSTDLYFPDAEGRFPALLIRTPYSNNTEPQVANARWYAERGYVVAVQDVRGKYDSEGGFLTYRNEADDGYDMDEWIGSQPWSDGKIGTLGGSYVGYTQLVQAIGGSRYLKAVAAAVTTSDIYNNWTYVDGALHYGFVLPWGAISTDGRVAQLTSAYDWPSVFLNLPVATSDEAASHVNESYREWLKHPRRSDPYWDGVSFEREIHRISVPMLVVDGWYDIFLRGALLDDASIRERSPSEVARRGKRLMIGPWAHGTGVRVIRAGSPTTGPDRVPDFGPDAEIDLRKVYLRWHDHWLKGIDNGVEQEPPIKIFVMGENVWRYENEWPLARTRYTKYYIDSGGRANSAAGDGVLGTSLPTGAEADRFTYDPAFPVPSAGGNVCCSSVPEGAWDQRKVEIREDVLVYSTPPLPEPMEVTGPILMKLHAATTAVDTDWTAKLVDVHPDGYAQNLQDGILRARFRNGPDAPASLLEPGKTYEYALDLWATSHVFLPGHRVRLEIASSNFPRFDRNLNTGEDPATGTRMVKAEQTVYHSARYPSHLLLPIVPRTTSTSSLQ
jgi:putative CocE/NonD family hydrolase